MKALVSITFAIHSMYKLLANIVSHVYFCVLCIEVVRYITWNSVERLSVMARTADIQVNANSGRTTQELHREALSVRE